MRLPHPLAAFVVPALVAVAASCSPPGASPGANAVAAADVDRLFDEFAGAESPGAAIAVVLDGEVVHRGGYGLADLEHDVPITPATVFDIASVSKQFAGMAIAMLVEEGRVGLDDDVRQYLPEMPDFGATVTLDHLVHHTSGLRDWPGTLAIAGWRMDDVISFEQILRMARAQRELNFEPGAEYSYSNTGYNLLAETVSRVTGQTYREWTEAQILGPLRMSNSHMHDDHTEVVPGRALGYQRGRGGFVNVANGLTALGSSSLYSTVEDLALWMMNFDDGRVGGASVIGRMEDQGTLNDGERIPYAFGQSRSEFRGLESWNHTGSWAGFRSVLMRFPAQGLGVVILSNLGSYDPTPTALAVAELYLGDAMAPPSGGDGPANGPTPDDRDEPDAVAGEADLDAYTGEYYSPELDTTWRIDISDGGLVARHWRHGDIRLERLRADDFTGNSWFVPSLMFERDARGQVSAFRISQPRSRNVRFEMRTRDPV